MMTNVTQRRRHAASKLRLSEAEIILACQFSGSFSRYDEPYQRIQEGHIIVLWTEVDEEVSSLSDSGAFQLRLTVVKSGQQRVEGAETDPPSKLFEATVLRSTGKLVKPGQKVFGVIFPEFASLVDSGPRSNYTDRRIRAAIAYFGAEQKESVPLS